MNSSTAELKRLAEVDLSYVQPIHEPVHARLLNWARWCRGSGGGSSALPMFQGYRNGYEEAQGGGTPVDTIDALAIQRAFIRLPERHRWVVQWWYCKPFIPIMKIRRALSLTTPGLSDLIHDARTMMKNLSQ